jgi:hypothetical protein
MEDEDTTDLRLFNQEVNVTNPIKHRPQKPPLMMSNMCDLTTFLVSESGQNRDFITHLYQKHGDVVQVCVCWGHQVVNLEECMKYVFDYCNAKDAMQCVYINNLLHALYKGCERA